MQPSIESGRAEQDQSAKPALLEPISSDGDRVLSHALVAEPYSSGTMRPGASKAVLHLVRRVPCWAACPSGTVKSRRSRETLAHGYTRPPGPLGDELGGLSTALRLFASLPLILSTESVVVVEWKVMSTAIATRAASPGRPQCDGRHKRKTGTTRAHELGWSSNFDPCARG